MGQDAMSEFENMECCRKSCSYESGEKVVELKENRSLFARIVIAAHAGPEIDLEEVVGKYEFSRVSHAVFASDGIPLSCQNKSKLVVLVEQAEPVRADEHIERQPDDSELDQSIATQKAVIMDEMAILHETPFQHGPNTTCKHLAEQFIQLIEKKIVRYDIVHLILF